MEAAMHTQVCVEDRWMKSTKILRYLQLFDEFFKASPCLFTVCTDGESLHKMINTLARCSKHHDATWTLTRLGKVGDGKQRNRHNLSLAFLFMLKYEGSDACWALVERVKERIHRCKSA